MTPESLVGDKGLEPLREHMILSHARLPIPPIPHMSKVKPLKPLAQCAPAHQVLAYVFTVGAVYAFILHGHGVW